jgi:hypothetical protein
MENALNLADDDPAWVYNAAYVDSTEMYVGDELVFDAAAEGSLAEVIQAVGEAILTALALFATRAAVRICYDVSDIQY